MSDIGEASACWTPYRVREIDAASGEWSAVIGHEQEVPLYGFLNWAQRRRLSANSITGDESSIDLVPEDPLEPESNSFGSSRADRLALLNRIMFRTREEFEARASEPMSPEVVSAMTRSDFLLRALADIAVQAPYGRPIECGLWELPELFPPWHCHREEPDHQSDGHNTIRSYVRDELGRRGEPDDEDAVLAYLRALLSDRWTAGTLADIGVTCEIDGDLVRLSFTDPCHENRKRLGKRSL